MGDTSVWVSVTLAAPVRVELLTGSSRRDRPRLRRVLAALPLVFPTAATWELVDRWVDRAGDAGERFGFADLLIGALAAERSASVWSLDDDFARMARLQLVARHVPD